MLAKKDKDKVLELLKQGKITVLLTYVPQIADEILFMLTNVINSY